MKCSRALDTDRPLNEVLSGVRVTGLHCQIFEWLKISTVSPAQIIFRNGFENDNLSLHFVAIEIDL